MKIYNLEQNKTQGDWAWDWCTEECPGIQQQVAPVRGTEADK